MTDEPVSCECCGDPLRFAWTDTHGVGVCVTCGLPYRIYHYENGVRVDRQPSVVMLPSGVEIAKRYWAEKKRRVWPGTFDMGILHGRSYSYSGATESDMHDFDEWYGQNKDTFPEPTPEAA